MQVEGRRLIDELGLQLLPGGFCLWGPTLLASDLLLGSAKAKSRPLDHQLLRCLSHTARETKASRIVLLGSLFSPNADPEGDLPGLLVPWRSELLEVEIAWVYAKAAPQWDQILDFLEISRIASGAKLGEAELLSVKEMPANSNGLSFVGGVRPFILSPKGKKAPAWGVKGLTIAFPSCGGATTKKEETADWDWSEELMPIPFPEPEGDPSAEEAVNAIGAAL